MTKFYFYQSSGADNTEVDFSNPLHVEIFNELTGPAPKRQKITKLMKAAGFTPGEGLRSGSVVWASDLSIAERDETGKAVKWYHEASS